MVFARGGVRAKATECPRRGPKCRGDVRTAPRDASCLKKGNELLIRYAHFPQWNASSPFVKTKSARVTAAHAIHCITKSTIRVMIVHVVAWVKQVLACVIQPLRVARMAFDYRFQLHQRGGVIHSNGLIVGQRKKVSQRGANAPLVVVNRRAFLVAIKKTRRRESSSS